MISFLVGVIEEKGENSLVLDVNGVGYELAVSSTTLSTLPMAGESVKIFTYMAVREDGVFLFGFSSKEERDVFFKLISVSGVGPKMAITILSGLSLSDLTIAIVKEDSSLLSKIKGLGKKTAERIILELKGKLGELNTALISDFSALSGATSTACDEACELLVNMGLSKFDALKLVNKVALENDTTEMIIQKALKNMN